MKKPTYRPPVSFTSIIPIQMPNRTMFKANIGMQPNSDLLYFEIVDEMNSLPIADNNIEVVETVMDAADELEKSLVCISEKKDIAYVDDRFEMQIKLSELLKPQR